MIDHQKPSKSLSARTQGPHSSAATRLDRTPTTTADHGNDDETEEAPFVVVVAVAAVPLDVGVVSPSVLETLPRSVLSRAQIFCMPLTIPGRLAELASRNDVWFVWMKLARRL